MIEKIQSTGTAPFQHHEIQDTVDHPLPEMKAEYTAKERNENGPHTLWQQIAMQSDENTQRSIVIEPVRTDEQRLTALLILWGNSEYKWPALHMALCGDDFEAALFLIEHGANCREPIYVNRFLYWPIDLLFTGGVGTEKSIEKKLGLNDRPPRKFNKDNTEEGKKDITRKIITTLINKGALNMLNGQWSRNIYTVMHQMRKNNWYDLFDVMATATILGNGTAESWNSFFNTLIRDNDMLAIEILDKNFKNNHNAYLPKVEDRLIMAIKENNLNMARYFVDNGANVNYQISPSSKRPLELATQLHNDAIIAFLISKGARLG